METNFKKANYFSLYISHRELWENDYRLPWPLRDRTPKQALSQTSPPRQPCPIKTVNSSCEATVIPLVFARHKRKNNVLSVFSLPRGEGRGAEEVRGTDERSARKRQFLCLISGKYNQRKETEEEAEEETSTTRRG